MWWLVGGVLAPFYLLVPFIVWAKQRMPVVAPMRRVARDEVPEPVAREVEAWERALGGTGLTLQAIHHSAPSPDSPHAWATLDGHVLHFADRGRALHALHYIMPRAAWRILITELADGDEVATASAASPSIYARDPRSHTLRAPIDWDLARLHALHLAHVEHVRPGAARVMREGQALLDFVPEHERVFMERQEAMGVVVSEGDLCRPTLRSAFLFTWRMLPPLRQVQKLRHARLRRRVKAGMADQPRTG